MNIGNKLRGIRTEKGYTTLYMAEKLGVSEPTYRKYEKNESFPDINMVAKMATVLEKNFLELLPSECFVQNNNDQQGGVVINLGTINNLSEKLIEHLEQSLLEKNEMIKEKNEIIKDLKKIS